ncbi:hypothetical protein ABEB36_012178 [Hypothenemus hampei]|uniref:Uncharacterized protein n=1 Tax=Hypothenemus hampei TaxID=57062 RepID=A0ABD1EEN5_HYPHA
MALTCLYYVLLLAVLFANIWLRNKEFFTQVLIQVDQLCIPISYSQFGKGKIILDWAKKRLPHHWSSHFNTLSDGVAEFWKDGSLLCTLINSAVPGACSNPYRHWKKPPVHGQTVAYKYLGVAPAFNESDFSLQLSPYLEMKLLNYIHYIYKTIYSIEREKLLYKFISPLFVARGMGLFTAQQFQEAEFFIYSKFNNTSFCNIEIVILGPYSTYCKTNVLEYVMKQRRTKDLHTVYESSPKNIKLEVEIEKDRLRVVYMSKFCGIHEINLNCNKESIQGSPFYVDVINYDLISSKSLSKVIKTTQEVLKSVNASLNKKLNSKAPAKDITKDFQPKMEITKYLKDLNNLRTFKHSAAYFTKENYMHFQKLADNSFRIPCSITRASPVLKASASPVCQMHTVPEDLNSSVSKYNEEASHKPRIVGEVLIKQEKFSATKSIKRLQNDFNKKELQKMVYEKKLFWERVFLETARNNCNKKCYERLRHVDSLYLLRKRPVSKSLSDLKALK